MRKLVALVGVGALCLSSLAAAGSGQVTLAVQVIELPGYEPTHAFSGRIERPVAGELVTVLGAVCPRTFETSMAGVTTTAGGGWETSTPVPKTSVTYRARWEGRFSEPVQGLDVDARRGTASRPDVGGRARQHVGRASGSQPEARRAAAARPGELPLAAAIAACACSATRAPGRRSRSRRRSPASPGTSRSGFGSRPRRPHPAFGRR